MQSACAVLSSVAFPTLKYFSTLYYKQYDFGRQVIENEMCFDFLYNCYLKHFPLQGEMSEI
jgi:hypothetical protein